MDRVQVGILLRQYHYGLTEALYNLSEELPDEWREEVANPVVPGTTLTLGYPCLREFQGLLDRLAEDIDILLGENPNSFSIPERNPLEYWWGPQPDVPLGGTIYTTKGKDE